MSQYGIGYQVPPFVQFHVIADRDGEVTGVWGLDNEGHLWASMFDVEWHPWRRFNNSVDPQHVDNAVPFPVRIQDVT